MSEDAFDLNRFVAAQAPVFDAVLAELGDGRKRTHWMWFVFPQLRGLGASATSQYFGIASLDEARRYLVHPVLGARLVTCSELVLRATGVPSLRALFGTPDDTKFCSSMTLFAIASEPSSVFRRALDRWCPDGEDARTLELLRGELPDGGR